MWSDENEPVFPWHQWAEWKANIPLTSRSFFPTHSRDFCFSGWSLTIYGAWDASNAQAVWGKTGRSRTLRVSHGQGPLLGCGLAWCVSVLPGLNGTACRVTPGGWFIVALIADKQFPLMENYFKPRVTQMKNIPFWELQYSKTNQLNSRNQLLYIFPFSVMIEWCWYSVNLGPWPGQAIRGWVDGIMIDILPDCIIKKSWIQALLLYHLPLFFGLTNGATPRTPQRACGEMDGSVAVICPPEIRLYSPCDWPSEAVSGGSEKRRFLYLDTATPHRNGYFHTDYLSVVRLLPVLLIEQYKHTP